MLLRKPSSIEEGDGFFFLFQIKSSVEVLKQNVFLMAFLL